jgi:hypothetical protein
MLQNSIRHSKMKHEAIYLNLKEKYGRSHISLHNATFRKNDANRLVST